MLTWARLTSGMAAASFTFLLEFVANGVDGEHGGFRVKALAWEAAAGQSISHGARAAKLTCLRPLLLTQADDMMPAACQRLPNPSH